MRVVFMGTPEFAVPSLVKLTSAADVVAVYTRPDAVSGRGGKTRPSPVAEAAVARGLDIHKPATLRTDDVRDGLARFKPDLLVVAAYGMILPPAVLEIAPLGAVNVHASLLPRWRGAAPIQRAILAGDTEVGVSIMQMEAGLDTGAYCLQRSTPVGDRDAVTLTTALAALGADALVEALPSISDGSVVWIAQDESLVTYADKIAKGDVAISSDMALQQVMRRIRASSPAAPCRVTIAGRGATVLEAASREPSEGEAALAQGGVRADKRGLLLGVADGTVLVTRLKPDGKGAMAAADWARGVHDLETSGWDTLR